jgi:hypothetical protein
MHEDFSARVLCEREECCLAAFANACGCCWFLRGCGGLSGDGGGLGTDLSGECVLRADPTIWVAAQIRQNMVLNDVLCERGVVNEEMRHLARCEAA